MEQIASSQSQLEYAPAAPVLRRRRFRRAIIALIVVVGGVALWRAGPPFVRQVRYVYWQSQCMNFTAPPNFVAYEEDPTRTAALLKLVEYQPVPVPFGPAAPAGFVPPPVTHLWSHHGPLVFLHERTTPSGRKRLVVLGYSYRLLGSFFAPQRELSLFGSGRFVATLLPGSEIQGDPHNRLFISLNPQDKLRFFWGQLDPDHADHFTVDYLLNDQPGTIDGYLKDDGQLDLRVRDGPAKKIAATLLY